MDYEKFKHDKEQDVYGGRLPVHVRCLVDETANIGPIPNLEKPVATIRSREISACLFLQAKSQLKASYKDNTDTIIGNMDSQLFLGGTEPTTLKDLSQFLGKETIDMYNIGESRGNNPSYSMNYQKSGKDLMTVDEIAVMDGDKCTSCSFEVYVHFCRTNMMSPSIHFTRRLVSMMRKISLTFNDFCIRGLR